MKKAILFLALMLSVSSVFAKKALVVIAHGAPADAWNAPVLALEPLIQKANMPGIEYKRVALMEFSHPDIAEVVADCEKQGVDTVFALPLFIAPSSHSDGDVPNILGLQYNPTTRKGLAEEKEEIIKSNIRFIEGPTLYEGDVIEKAMLARIKEMSTDPKNEGVVLLAHGDPGRIGFWNNLLKRTKKMVQDSTGIEYFDNNLVGMGQEFDKDVKPLLQKAAKEKKRVLVQGLYLMSSVNSMAKMFKMDQPEYLKEVGADVVYSKAGILPASSDLVVDWITKTTNGWVESLTK